MLWSKMLKKPILSIRKKFVGFARSEGMEFGVSWKNIFDGKTFLVSVEGPFIEDDEFSHYILRSICDQIFDAAIRVVEKHPEIAMLDSKEYQAIVSMFQYSNDVDAAEKSGMSLDSYRYTIRVMRERFSAENRYDMIRKVFHLS
jgi:protein associated with RNAse G/E